MASSSIMQYDAKIREFSKIRALLEPLNLATQILSRSLGQITFFWVICHFLAKFYILGPKNHTLIFQKYQLWPINVNLATQILSRSLGQITFLWVIWQFLAKIHILEPKNPTLIIQKYQIWPINVNLATWILSRSWAKFIVFWVICHFLAQIYNLGPKNGQFKYHAIWCQDKGIFQDKGSTGTP